MSRFQWILISIILAVGLLAGGILLSLDSLTPVQSAEEHEEGSEAEKHGPEGPHEGVLLGEEAQPVKLEVVSRAKGPGKLQLSFYAIGEGGRTLEPGQSKLQASWERLGEAHPLALKTQKEAWVAQSLIDEPHSFALTARLVVAGKTYTYAWEKYEHRLELEAEQLRESKITFAQAGPRTLSETLELPGKIAVDQTRDVHLTPRLGGIVTAIYTHLGHAVTKGQLLAVLESRELGDLRLDFLQASQRYEQARQRYEIEQGFFNHTTRLIRGLQRGDNIESLHRELLGQVIGADRQTLVGAYSEFRLAHQTYTREKTLLPQQATSRAEFQQAEQAFVAARAAYQAAIEEAGRSRRLQLFEREQDMKAQAPAVEMARRKLQSLGAGTGGSSLRYELRAPISGTIIAQHIAAGEQLLAEAEAFQIADLSQVWAEMMIPESQLGAVRLGQRVEVVSQTGRYRSGAIVEHLGATVDEASRTSESHADLLNPERLWKPGMFVTIQLESNPYRVPVAVPPGAIQSLEGEDMVFVRDGEALQAIPVELGRRSRQWVEVREGLEPGMRYAATNSFLLKAELEKALAADDD